jgi:hypothetical protein
MINHILCTINVYVGVGVILCMIIVNISLVTISNSIC